MTEQEINQCAHELYGVMAATGEIDHSRGLLICADLRDLAKNASQGVKIDMRDPMSERMFKAAFRWGVTPDDMASIVGRISMRILKDANVEVKQ